MYYYLYKITHLISGKIYIGAHSTNDINDGYMGSGLAIRRAIIKHGIHEFSKKILQFFENSDEMFAAEKDIVNEEFVNREDTYNINIGGHGGWHHINSSPETKMECVLKGLDTRKNWSEELKYKERCRKSLAISGNNNYFFESKRNGKENPMFGKTHTDETKAKISESNIGKVVIITPEGDVLRVNVDDENYIKGVYKSINCGYVVVRNENGDTFRVKSNDERFTSGELVSVNLGRNHSEENKEKFRQQVLDTKWYNNGSKNKRAKLHPGEGWVEGRMPMKKMPPKKWFTNGKINVFVRYPEDETWVEGRTKIEKIWVNKGEIEKIVLLTEKQNYIDSGWVFGRLR